jgi:uncharacterized repeat protein (TIGR01451 family)
MNVDPADDCTFWYTNEYVSASGLWQTHVGSFKISGCGGVTLYNQVSDKTPTPGQTITYTIVVANNYGSNLTNAVISNTMPAGVNFVGPIELDPSGAGIVGITPPTLASSLTIASGENITVTFPVTVSALTGTIIINSAAITSTEIPEPTIGSVSAFVGGVETYLPITFKN